MIDFRITFTYEKEEGLIYIQAFSMPEAYYRVQNYLYNMYDNFKWRITKIEVYIA